MRWDKVSAVLPQAPLDRRHTGELVTPEQPEYSKGIARELWMETGAK